LVVENETCGANDYSIQIAPSKTKGVMLRRGTILKRQPFAVKGAMIGAMHTYLGALQVAMIFGLAVLLFRPRRRMLAAWLAIAVLLVVVSLFTTQPYR
jgi:hypothetical protein